MKLLFPVLVPILLIQAPGLDVPPTSARSRKAVARVMPGLKQDMAALQAYPGAPVFLRLFKAERELELWVQGPNGRYILFRTYTICTYSGKPGPKLAEGDHQAPEGFYQVHAGLMNPWSSYHLSFNVGYPNRYDRSHGRTGSFIMIHGSCVSIGCYAMTDPSIEEIYALVEAALVGGQKKVPVHIFPFRMTRARMEREKEHQWFGFWQNLKEGYDYFERDKNLPVVGVKRKRYTFERPSKP